MDTRKFGNALSTRVAMRLELGERELLDRLRLRLEDMGGVADFTSRRWATLCLVTVSNDSKVVHSVLSKASNLVSYNFV